MPKGDDHLLKKKNKAVRKRMRRAGADTLEAIRGIQAAKRRRKAGTRRACEGMCYTLPSQEDPFNDRNDKTRTRKQNAELRKRKVPAGEILEFETCMDNAIVSNADASSGYGKQLKKKRISDCKQKEASSDVCLKDLKKQSNHGRKILEGQSCYSKQCFEEVSKRSSPTARNLQLPDSGEALVSKEVNVINESFMTQTVAARIKEAGLLNDYGSNDRLSNGMSEKGSNVHATVLGQQCWKAFTEGVDVIANSSLSWEERALAYVVSAAAHIKAHNAKHAVQHSPVVLVMVATKDQALKVRFVFKALKKPLGVSSVSVHTGRTLESQVKGFSLHTPEIVISTLERLEDLLAVQAISLLNISFLVIDGLTDILDKNFESHLLRVKKQLPQGARTLVICNKFYETTVNIIRQVVLDPIARVMSEPQNLESNSACITQAVSVFTSLGKRLPKMLKILQQCLEQPKKIGLHGILILVENAETAEKLIPPIKDLGYIVAGLTSSEDNQLQLVNEQLRQGSVQMLVTTEQFLGSIPLHIMQLTINYSFPSTIHLYKQILTGMARQTVHGILHSFCTAAMACLAQDFVQILQSCSQEVHIALKMLVDAASLVQNGKKQYLISQKADQKS